MTTKNPLVYTTPAQAERDRRRDLWRKPLTEVFEGWSQNTGAQAIQSRTGRVEEFRTPVPMTADPKKE